MEALEASPTPWVLAIASGTAEPPAEKIGALWAARGTAQAVVFAAQQGGPQPLPGLYSKDALGCARAAIASGRTRLLGLLGELEVAQLGSDERPLESALKPPRDHVRVIAGIIERLPGERPIRLFLNAEQIATMYATPDQLEDLAIGFLVGEGMITRRDDLLGVFADYSNDEVRVETAEQIAPAEERGEMVLTAGCARGLTFSSLARAQKLEPVRSSVCIPPETLYRFLENLKDSGVRYHDQGGVHTCGLAVDGKLIIVRDDVGHHNAVDKVFGRAWIDRIPMAEAVFLTTGRISFEMVVRAVRSGIPYLITRTAASDLAAQIAEDLGVTLIGYSRGGRMTVYSHPQRVQAQLEDERAFSRLEHEGEQ